MSAEPKGLKLYWMMLWPALLIMASIFAAFGTGLLAFFPIHWAIVYRAPEVGLVEKIMTILLACLAGLVSWGLWARMACWCIDKLRPPIAED